MSVEFNIQEQSCALLVQHADGKHTFLGTAFYFVHAGQTFAATAAHCVPDALSGQLCTVANTLPVVFRNVAVAVLDHSHDLCLLTPSDPPQDVTLVLGDERNVEANVPMYCFEYSTTQYSGGSWHINPATRVGNCVRLVQMTDRFGPAGVDMLEVSFPAIKGASGAPLIQLRHGQHRVKGVVVANAEQHLLPAHIETVLTEDNSLLEELKYFLPQAVAVHAQHLARITDEWLARVNGVRVIL